MTLSSCFVDVVGVVATPCREWGSAQRGTEGGREESVTVSGRAAVEQRPALLPSS